MKRFIILSFMTLLAVETAFAQKEIVMPTEKGNITLLMDRLATGGAVSTVEGAIRNDTSFKLYRVFFELVGYNAANVRIKACGQIVRCSIAALNPVDPNGTVRLTSPGNSILLEPSLQSAIARMEFRITDLMYYIKYDIRSTPVATEKFTIAPRFTLDGIGLDIQNTSGDVLEVAWDQSVYIDEDGNSSRLVKANVNLAEKDRPQPNTVIPPRSKLQETVFPVDHIRQVDGRWKQVPLLPDIAVVSDPGNESNGPEPNYYRPGTKLLAGKEVRLFLRLLVDDKKQNVTIPFKIANMVQ